MPARPLRPCAWPGGCVEVQVSSYCDAHERTIKRLQSKHTHKREHQRLYDRRWLRIRAAQLAEHPWCARCLRDGRHTLATDVHHLERHEGDAAKFYGSLLESECHACHSSETALEVGLNISPAN